MRWSATPTSTSRGCSSLVYESLKLLLFVGLWLGIIFGFDSFEQWQAQRRRLLELQKTLAEAQLSQLKAQLRPHFFFNALNTISALMHVDVERADRLLARLGELLRTSLQINDQEMTTLREELRTLELFAQIMQERFADRVVAHLEHRCRAARMQGAGDAVAAIAGECIQARRRAKRRASEHRDQSRLAWKAQLAGRSSAIPVRRWPTDYRDGVGLRNCRERLKVIYGIGALPTDRCRQMMP